MLLRSFGDSKVQDNGDSETHAFYKILTLQNLHPSITRSNHALHCVICRAENRVLWVKDIALANILIISALWCNMLHFRGQKMLFIFMWVVSKTDALVAFREGGNTKTKQNLGKLPLFSFKAVVVHRSFFTGAHAFCLSGSHIQIRCK